MSTPAELQRASADLAAQLKQLEVSFGQLLPRESTNVARRTVVRVAAGVRDDIRQAAPKDQGTLTKAIRSQREKAGPLRAEAGVRVTTGADARNDAFYWKFLEFGTKNMRARPFILPTIKAWSSKVVGVFAREFWPQLEKEMAKRGKKT